MGAARVSLSLSEELATVLDELCRARGEDRSRLVETLLRENPFVRAAVEQYREAWTVGGNPAQPADSALTVQSSSSVLATGPPIRIQLLQLITNKPGMHTGQLCREIGVSWGTLQHHLAALSKQEQILSVSVGRERRFFPADMNPQDLRALAVLSRDHGLDVANYILDNPGATVVEVSREVGLSRQTSRRIIQALVQEGLILEDDRASSRRVVRFFPGNKLTEATAALSPTGEGSKVASRSSRRSAG